MNMTAKERLHRRKIFSEVPFEIKASVPCLVYYAGNYLWVVRKATGNNGAGPEWSWDGEFSYGIVYAIIDEMTPDRILYHANPRHRTIAVNATFADWDTAVAYVASSAQGVREPGYGLQEAPNASR